MVEVVNIRAEIERGEREMKVRYNSVLALADGFFGPTRITGHGRGFCGSHPDYFYVDGLNKGGRVQTNIEVVLTAVGATVKVYNKDNFPEAEEFSERYESLFNGEQVRLEQRY